MDRRRFLLTSLAAIPRARAAAPPPQFGHRQANMVNEPGPAVFDLARRIPGLSGVELQVQFKGTTLWDRETLLSYKKASEATHLPIPSLAGIWPQGANLWSANAGEILRKAIGCARDLHASTVLVVCLEASCPKMDQEQSYGPAVASLQQVAPEARDSGVTLALESSLVPADDRKLLELVNRPEVKVYYDLDNVERYHRGDAVPGVETLGAGRIRQVHLKNENRLLQEPGRVDWAAAVKALARIGYKGWFVFETSHAGPEQCVEATAKNIAFVKQCWVA